MKLDDVVAKLEAMEDTIIMALLERAQFRQNLVIYEAGRSGMASYSALSLFMARLRMVEEIDARMGRFIYPEEKAVSSWLPHRERSCNPPANSLCLPAAQKVNLKWQVILAYFDLILPLCKPGDDGQHGSAVEHDVNAINAMSERVHYGSFYAAEAKFLADREEYTRLIRWRDSNAIMERLTVPEREMMVLNRVDQKTDKHQQDISESRIRVDPRVIVAFYEKSLIPLTKKGQMEYLMARTV